MEVELIPLGWAGKAPHLMWRWKVVKGLVICLEYVMDRSEIVMERRLVEDGEWEILGT